MTSVTLHHFRVFAHEHDDIPAFHAAYLVGTFLAAAVFNLGFFEILIAGHMVLDYFKYREVHGFSLSQTFKAVIIESISDIALFLLALTFSVYLSHTFLLAGVSGILRSQLTILEALGTLLPKVQILEHMTAVFFGFHAYLHSVHPGVTGPLTRIQKVCFALTLVCLLLLALSFVFFLGQEQELFNVFKQELIPHL